jgi:hypothetical protein
VSTQISLLETNSLEFKTLEFKTPLPKKPIMFDLTSAKKRFYKLRKKAP